jgi:hypothetical protein
MFYPKHTLCIVSDSVRCLTTLSFAEIVVGRWMGVYDTLVDDTDGREPKYSKKNLS